jgi:hypothetical protein
MILTIKGILLQIQEMSTGDTWVVLEHYPNKHGKFTGIRLEKSQWLHLKSQFDVILDYVSAVETGKSG